MTVQEFCEKAISVLNFCAFYYTLQIVRCVLVSFAVSAVVMILRKTILKNHVFLKGAVWALFIPVLFVGKMKFFDETRIGVLLSWLWKVVSINHVWVCWLYLCVMFAYAALLFHRRRRVKKLVLGMEKRMVGDTLIYVTAIPLTPFAAGVFHPRIVVPEIILKQYDEKELQMILLHERMHIRLGHLLFYLLWDILRVLLWLDPLLTIGTRYFREDMEEICDWATIWKSRGEAYRYGQLLLKSMRILQTESEDFNMYAAFADAREFQNIRQRVIRISGYKPHKRIVVAGTAVFAALCIAGSIGWIHSISYGRNIENESVMVYGYDHGDVTFTSYSDELRQMISYDDNYVYVERQAFETFLRDNGAKGEIFIVFGGFYKLPGVGGLGYSCQYENDTEEPVVRIPYYNYEDSWLVKLEKML